MIKLSSGTRVEVNNLPARSNGGSDTPKAGLWTGEGPPPEVIPGSSVGDEYLDILSGEVYRLEPGD